MILAEKVFDEVFTARNFNTSPLTISSLQGDLYDYEAVIKMDNGPNNVFLLARLNADTGGNYRNYHMRGANTVVSAAVSDAATSIRVGFSKTNPSLVKIRITGSSGEERYIDTLGANDATSVSSIYKYSDYWKNTVDEVTSITFLFAASNTCDAHIILYRTPKVASQAGWELMETLSWSSETAEKSFTVNGDRDIKYKIVWIADSVGNQLNLEFNNDNGSNYLTQVLRNNSGSITASNSTNSNVQGRGRENSAYIINAESGVKRLVNMSTASSSGGGVQQIESSIWWSNTVDNLTSIDCTPAGTVTGTAKLYRKINPKSTADTLNFEGISSEDFSSTDFSSGTTHTIAGDSMTLLKIEGVLSNASGDIEIRMQLNSDTASNYPEQLLKADTSTVTAASSTRAYIVLAKLQQGDQAEFTHYLYTNSGANRPMLTECSYDENALEKLAQWWSNSVDEITTAKIYASSSNGITGNIKVSRLT